MSFLGDFVVENIAIADAVSVEVIPALTVWDVLFSLFVIFCVIYTSYRIVRFIILKVKSRLRKRENLNENKT